MPRVVDATEWPQEQIQPYIPQLADAIDKLVARYPDDMTAQALAEEWRTRRRRVWLILDDDLSFMAFAMTRISTIEATGVKMATLCDVAGERVLEAADELCNALESYADQVGAPVRNIEGRIGWKKVLARKGYEPQAMLYRKKVEIDG